MLQPAICHHVARQSSSWKQDQRISYAVHHQLLILASWRPSSSPVLHAGSSQANPFACIASGIAALWGPAHGGANEAVLRMLQDIGSRDKIPEAIKRAKDKNDSFRCALFWLHPAHRWCDMSTCDLKRARRTVF